MLELRIDQDTLLVSVQGDLDMVVAKSFKETVDDYLLSHDWIKHLLVDLSDVGFIDSSGLGVLIGRYKVMKNRHGQMAICGVNNSVYRILEISGLKKLMPVLKITEPAAQ